MAQNRICLLYTSFLHGEAELIQDRPNLRREEFLTEERRSPVADRILHQVKAVQFKGDLAVQRQQNAVGVQFGGRSDLRPVCPKVDKISLMRVVFDAAVPHMRCV